MKLAAYLRVSTDRQADEGLGLQIQRRAIDDWAKTHGHRIAAWFSDDGVSGSNGLDTREALPDALDLLRRGGAQGFVVYRLDRLARDLILQESLLAEIKKLGGEVFSTADGESTYLSDAPDDPSRRLIRQVLGAVSEYERSMIALRLRSGRRMKARQGGFAYGSPPFGYDASNGSLTEAPEQQAALARAQELHGRGNSLRSIADTLEREGHKSKRGGSWHPTTLSRALRRAAGPGPRRNNGQG